MKVHMHVYCGEGVSLSWIIVSPALPGSLVVVFSGFDPAKATNQLKIHYHTPFSNYPEEKSFVGLQKFFFGTRTDQMFWRREAQSKTPLTFFFFFFNVINCFKVTQITYATLVLRLKLTVTVQPLLLVPELSHYRDGRSVRGPPPWRRTGRTCGSGYLIVKQTALLKKNYILHSLTLLLNSAAGICDEAYSHCSAML